MALLLSPLFATIAINVETNSAAAPNAIETMKKMPETALEFDGLL